MFSKRTQPLILLATLAGALALGCASSLPGVQAIPLSANPAEQIQSLSSDVSSAQERDVDVLAPTWFGRAAASLAEGRSLHERGGSARAILRLVSEGRAQLQQAESLAKVTALQIGPAIRARGDARTAGAARIEDYDEAEKAFLALGAAVESDNLSSAKRNTPGVERMFRTLELNAIKKNTMERIEDLIAKAKSDGAEDLAPRSLRVAERSYRDLDSYITQNRYAREETTKRANEALFEASRLVYLTQQAKVAKKQSPEDAALAREELVARFSGSLVLPDLRNQSPEAQVRGVENGIRQLAQDRNFLANRVELLQAQAENQRSRISLLEGQSADERRQLEALEAQRRFNNRFAEVSAGFTPAEAEVYKQGQSLVIRLRSIEFPVGATVVLPKSYPLMAKVQRAIRSFDEPRVVIEGHTDSTGSTEVNERISQARADAVKAYLSANNTVSDDRLTAVGKGFSVPLASDRTAEGRAQNRRIDIIIDAHEPDLRALPSVSQAGE